MLISAYTVCAEYPDPGCVGLGGLCHRLSQYYRSVADPSCLGTDCLHWVSVLKTMPGISECAKIISVYNPFV